MDCMAALRVGAGAEAADVVAADGAISAGAVSGKESTKARHRRGKQAKMTSSQRKHMKKMKQRGRDG